MSGKKTQSKLLAEKIGGLKVFDMNEIIREALTYVDPSAQKEEVVDPKAKGKKAAAADTTVDQFAG